MDLIKEVARDVYTLLRPGLAEDIYHDMYQVERYLNVSQLSRALLINFGSRRTGTSFTWTHDKVIELDGYNPFSE